MYTRRSSTLGTRAHMPRTPSTDEGFGKLLGMELYERGDGYSRGRLTVRPELLNPHGTLHGGVMYSLADSGMGSAVYSKMAPDESCATIEIQMVYIAAVREGTLECETRVLNKGRRVAVLESEVRNGDRLVAKALGTFAIFPISAPNVPNA